MNKIKTFLQGKFLFIFGPFIFLWLLRYIIPNYTISSKTPHWAYIPPKSCLGGCGSIDGLIPFVDWTNALIQFLRKYEIFGLFTFRDFTRGIANYIDKFLDALPWSIIAGPRRGVVGGTGVQSLEFAFDKFDRDVLEPFGYNPIVFERGVGLTIKGNKTAQQGIQSALSSAHVREVLIYIEDGLAEILKNYLFEFNNAQTRLEIKTLADNFMESVKKDGGVFDYKNIMDTSNNTSEVIDNNMGILDTFVEPVKGLEILVSRVTVLNTGEIATGNFA